MKLLSKSIFILMFGLVPLSMHASILNTEEANHPEESYYELAADLIYQTGNCDDTEVNIVYLLDKDGKPYIISIRSEDERVNQMVRDMINTNEDADIHTAPACVDKTLAITFYYNHIR